MEQIVDLGINGAKILQDPDGYAFSQDSVILANIAAIPQGGRLLDLGCGCGILALLALLKRKAGSAVMLDVDKTACALASKNASLCGLDGVCDVVVGDVKDAKQLLKDGSFDAVICNPPYFEANPKLPASGARDIARRESTATLSDFVEGAAYALKNKGDLNIVVKAARLATLIHALVSAGLEPKKLTLVRPKPSKNADVAMIHAVKGGGRGLDVDILTVMNEDGTRTPRFEALYTEYCK